LRPPSTLLEHAHDVGDEFAFFELRVDGAVHRHALRRLAAAFEIDADRRKAALKRYVRRRSLAVEGRVRAR